MYLDATVLDIVTICEVESDLFARAFVDIVVVPAHVLKLCWGEGAAWGKLRSRDRTLGPATSHNERYWGEGVDVWQLMESVLL
jgi:hypothetical protein